MYMEIGYPETTEEWDLEHDDWRLAYAFGQALLDEDRSIEWMFLISDDGEYVEELHRVDTLREFAEVVEEWMVGA